MRGDQAGEIAVKKTLNEIEALALMQPLPFNHPSSRSVLCELASYLECDYVHVHAWVRRRAYSPRAATLLAMRTWIDQMKGSLNRSEKISYRHALERIEAGNREMPEKPKKEYISPTSGEKVSRQRIHQLKQKGELCQQRPKPRSPK